MKKQIITRAEHCISRNNISDNALKILKKLNKHGFTSYLVGGATRELLLDKQPKDFDIATDATPPQIKQLFSNSRIIGKRFKIVHIHYKGETIEVTTFRKAPNPGNSGSQQDIEIVTSDNNYGTLEEDALRRDFTINALYYTLDDFAIIDFTSGMQDLQHKIIRCIGDPNVRFREDPVRMLRAIRFAGKLDFAIEENAAEKIRELGKLLHNISKDRLLHEFQKLFLSHYSKNVFLQLQKFDLLKVLLPLNLADDTRYEQEFNFILNLLKNTEERAAQDLPLSTAFMFAALLWFPMQQLLQRTLALKLPKLSQQEILDNCMYDIINQQVQFVSVPHYQRATIYEIWHLQIRFKTINVKRCLKVVNNPKFRAAIDLLQLRSSVEPELEPLYQWWNTLYNTPVEQRKELIIKQDPEK